jgi:F0F1-type ATP synthase epsilon subunit
MILIALLNSSEIIITAATVTVAAIERGVVAIVMSKSFGAISTGARSLHKLTVQILCFFAVFCHNTPERRIRAQQEEDSHL